MKELFGINYQHVNDLLIKIGTNIVLCIVILIVGFWLAKMASKGIKKVLRKSHTDEGLVTFSASFASMMLKVLVYLCLMAKE